MLQLSYIETAGKSDLLLKSDLKDGVSALLFANDQIHQTFGSGHHQHICMACCGNDVGVSELMCW